MRILITGGNGYVGREVARLLTQEHEVCVIDSVRYGRMRFSPDELNGIRFERVDITDMAAVAQVVADFEPEAVIHLAAIHFIPECENDPELAIRTNVMGTVNLILSCPPQCRFVFASSGAVYRPASEPHEESSAVEPSDVYGLSKLHGEHYVRYLSQTRDLSSVIVRLFNVVGPGETNPHLIPEIIAQLKSGRRTIQLGNIWPKRDYIHVLDAARGFIATAVSSDVPVGDGVVVNLGTSRPYSVAEVLGKLRDIAGINFTYEQDNARVRATDRPYLAADNARIQRLFGWQPELTIDHALADLWRDPDLSEQLTAKYL